MTATSPARTGSDGLQQAREDFTDWVRPHWTPMARLAARLAPIGAAEEVLQESLSAAWRKRDQFDHDRGAARPWLLAVVADQAMKSRRRQRPVPLDDIDATAAQPHTDVVPDVDLRAALGRLAPRQRLAVVLHYYVDLPVSEVAEVMACSVGTVKSTLSDARRVLRERLGEEER